MKSLSKKLLKLRWKSVWLLLLFPVLILSINLWIILSNSSKVYTDESQLPFNEVGLVLGASPRLAGRKPNPHFLGRIETAAHLYHIGKVKHLLVSGDGYTQRYDETIEMKKQLLKHGVPESAITLDHAGLRTLDSIVRAKEVYGLDHLTIITDDFHVSRALFLSRYHSLDAVAFCSEKVPIEKSKRFRAREWLARVKAFMDVYLLDTQPRIMAHNDVL